MPEELFGVLSRFHREVVVPDIERMFDAKLDRRIGGFRRTKRYFEKVNRNRIQPRSPMR